MQQLQLPGRIINGSRVDRAVKRLSLSRLSLISKRGARVFLTWIRDAFSNPAS
jgi:hypothetical protein